ncbi:MAG: LamG-like jellyroll fold domain-containing protein, partial [Candidatus Micrarchaeaceae archaeon]
LVNASIGKQVVQAVAYTPAHIVSSPSYQQANKYLLPSSGTINITNAYGTICIDYNCTAPSNIASKISMSSQVVHAAQFNGQSSYISGQGVYAFPLTDVEWIYPTSYGSSNFQVLSEFDGNAPDFGSYQLALSTTGNVTVWNGATTITTTLVAPLNQWSLVGFSLTTGTLTVYLNYKVQTIPLSTSAVSSSYTYWIFGWQSGFPTRYFSGSMSNCQIYNTALSAGQIQQLYQEGIGGAPLANAGLVGWWPLNGNANDYSGNGNNGVIHGPLLFPTVAELLAKVTNNAGQAVANDLVGFTTTLGNFLENPFYINYTNSNGIAIAFLNQNLSTGIATVKATAFNGNISVEHNLVAWYPLDLGQGSSAYDISGYGNTGRMQDTAWSNPNYVANLNPNSYISVANASSLNPTASATVLMWIKPGSSQTAAYSNLYGKGPGQPFVQFVGNSSVLAGIWGTTPTPAVQINKNWTLVAATYYLTNGNTLISLYVDGLLEASITATGSMAANNYPLQIGSTAPTFSNGGYFNGSIANIQLYNTNLTNSQIASIYATGISAPPIASGNLAAWWPLNGDAKDYSGNNNNGTLYGPIGFISTQSLSNINANASSTLTAQFNGASSYISTFYRNVTPSGWTESAWVKIAGNSAGWCGGGHSNVVLNDRGSGAGYSLTLGTTPASGSLFGFFFGWDTNGVGYFAATNPVYSYNTLYYLTGVYNSSFGFKLYVNGEEVAYYTKSGVASGPTCNSGALPSYFNSTFPWIIGYEQAWNSFFDGQISNIQLYSTPLSPNQIQLLYSEGIGAAPLANAGLVGWWPLNGNANDYSGFGNNGTATSVGYSNVESRTYNPISSL